MTPANLLTQWARLLLATFADSGVADVVISPGSRSSPFILAAEAEPRLRTHGAVDERAAGFFALGQVRLTGRPSVLLCTSGTAVAHYLPAVVEANLAHLPLLVVSADRPLELQDSGAPQAIDQVKLMGDQVRRFYDVGTPDPDPAALAGLRRLAAQAVHHARSPLPGPVHVNVRARKPLEPAPAQTAEEHALEERVTRLLARPAATAFPTPPLPDPSAVRRVAELCAGTDRGLIVAGPVSPRSTAVGPAAFALARATGFPLLPETSSQLRLTDVPDDIVVCDAFNAVLRSRAFREAHRPDIVVAIGGVPASAGWEQLVAAHEGVTSVAVAAHGWPDPQSSVTHLLLGEPSLVLEELVETLGRPAPPHRSAWAAGFHAAARTAWRLIEEELARPGGGLSEGGAVRTVVERLPRDSLLMVGNSLPIREVDTFGRAGSARVRVLAQRGANGIDGLVSGAAGSASVADAPLTLLLGDVSLLHDLTGLALAPRSGAPFVVVALQNSGGRIFELLPVADAPGVPAPALRRITTPHEYSFEGAARMFGHSYAAAGTVEELAAALERAHANAGCTVVEAVVPPGSAAEQHRRIFAAVDRALGATPAGGGASG